ncbi:MULTISPECIES: YozE family protein [Companilactobacillus]|jgi:uncharacterized protein YozE (UPF0346 family)|uniref:YozE family protein n=1 Tax=Companilactobacillus TaxID=2767879 RepID=UPI0023311D5B|nr:MULTISPECIES: YozE family protein [Companilactobacillus]MDT6953543.1 YozE family protein [Companilactobacillus alimentarius]MDT6953569.1 YozE family protein [Companilactobacillus alimentarius]MDT6953675.1 YozE family protein [Companilactobacillus alimentarius]WCG36379.1 YozE family protein [Companilactobacillus farciminis]
MDIIVLSFYDWLMKFKDVDLSIGDLAKDAESDKNFPRKSKDLDDIIQHLNTMGASSAAIETAEEAFDYYKASHLPPDYSSEQ